MHTWRNPTRLVFGPGALEQIAVECGRFGDSVLLITNSDLVGSQHAVRARSLLRGAGIVSSDFAGVRPNPGVSIVREAVAALDASRANVVVGLGGGSSMDVAKVASVAAANRAVLEDPAWSHPPGLMIPDLASPGRPVPLIQVPTTLGTGAEVTQNASVRGTDWGEKKLLLHPLFFAQVAIVDPDLPRSLEPRRLAEAGVEVLARLLPPLTTDSGKARFQDGLALAAARVALDATPALVKTHGAEPEAMRELALTSTMSAQGWLSFGRPPYSSPLWLVQNTLGSLTEARKGELLAPLLPAYLGLLERTTEHSGWGHPSRWRTAAISLGLSPNAADPRGAASRAGGWAHTLANQFADWGLPRCLGELGITESDISMAAERTLKTWGHEGLAWAKEVDVMQLLHAAL